MYGPIYLTFYELNHDNQIKLDNAFVGGRSKIRLQLHQTKSFQSLEKYMNWKKMKSSIMVFLHCNSNHVSEKSALPLFLIFKSLLNCMANNYGAGQAQ